MKLGLLLKTDGLFAALVYNLQNSNLHLQFPIEGPEWHNFLCQAFTFETETEASKSGEFKKVATLPRCIHGKTKTVAHVNIFKCTAKVPCKVHLKLGFLANYEIGTEEW